MKISNVAKVREKEGWYRTGLSTNGCSSEGLYVSWIVKCNRSYRNSLLSTSFFFCFVQLILSRWTNVYTRIQT